MTTAAVTASNSVSLGPAIALIIVGTLLYFVPLIIALARRVRYRTAVAVVNVLLGWTGLGWIVALVMAVWPKPPPVGQVLRPPHGV